MHYVNLCDHCSLGFVVDAYTFDLHCISRKRVWCICLLWRAGEGDKWGQHQRTCGGHPQWCLRILWHHNRQMGSDRRGEKGNKTKHNIISHMTKVLQVMIKIDLNFKPLQRILGACFLSWRGHTVAGAAFDSLAVLQLTAWAMWAGARLREVWTH